MVMISTTVMIVVEEEMMMMMKKKNEDDEEEEQVEQIIIIVGMCWETLNVYLFNKAHEIRKRYHVISIVKKFSCRS